MNPEVQDSLARLADMTDRPLREYRDAILDEVCYLTRSELSYVAAMNYEEDILTMVGWSKTAMGNCAIMDRPLVYPLEDTGLWGDAVRERKPVITNDYASSDRPTKRGYPKGHVRVINHMNVPIFEAGKIVLVVGVGNKDGDYTKTDAHNIEALMTEVWATFQRTLWDETW